MSDRDQRGLARRRAGLFLFATGAAILAWLATQPSRAGADLVFTATSSAQGVQVELASTAVPLSTDTAAGGPTAQTLMDSNGTSHAYAASPDPSQTGATAPALVCSLSGLPIPPAACTYPAFATTDRGQPPQKVGPPGDQVSAQSGDTSADASVYAGSAPGPRLTTISHTAVGGDGSVSSTATITGDSISIGGVVTIHGLHIAASATSDPTGRVSSKQDLTMSALEVAGQSFSFANGTFTVPGNRSIVVPSGTVFGLMRQVGVEATFQQPLKTRGGTVSSALSFSYVIPATGASPASTVTVILGRASADITASAGPSTATFPASGGTGADLIPTAGVPVPPAGPTATPNTPAEAPASSSGTVAAAPPVASPAGVIPATGPGLVTRSLPPTLLSTRRPWTYRTQDLYLTLVAAAIALFAIASGVRLLGVRMPWNF